MNVKDIPTDNLYKFITIFCLFLAIACGVAIYKVDEVGRQRNRYLTEKIVALELIEQPTIKQKQLAAYYTAQRIQDAK